MVSTNPFAELRNQSETLLRKVIEKGTYPDAAAQNIILGIPSNSQFGELASSICFEMAKPSGKSPMEIARQIERDAEKKKAAFSLIKSVKAEGQGYVNFYADFAGLSSLALGSAKALDAEYGYVKTAEPQRIIVEHTSVNPIHPIHIGACRNSVLGDTLARILKARGHMVSRHYYIDDVGRQSALVAYGYKLLGRPKAEGKPDHFIGAIYAVTSCLLEIRKLKAAAKCSQPDAEDDGEHQKIQRDLDEWVAVAAELREKFPELFDRLLEETSKVEDPGSEVSLLLQQYEAGKEGTKQLIREVSQLCLEGFKQTLARAGITLDSWDWESTFVWNSDVTRCLEALKKTPFVFQEGEVLEFDADGVAEALDLKELFGVKKGQEIPSLTLGRADGTTLYTTRDIAYSIWKFKEADKVINVIGMEQKLPQLQLKLALSALGYVQKAKNLVHFAYNLVSLPGYKMSSRRGRYVTIDEVMDEAVSRAYNEVSKHSPELTEDEKQKISETVGVGAVKYAVSETEPMKPVVFTWDRVLNLERNSGPYIQYSHARACSILRKAPVGAADVDYSLLKEPLEHELVMMVARFPEIFTDAADNLKPSALSDYANALADKFNTFYAAYPVIKAETPELSNARLMLVGAVRITLHNALSLIGIEAPQRM
jgi:arginyl-tRNA synthetase